MKFIKAIYIMYKYAHMYVCMHECICVYPYTTEHMHL